MLVYSLRECSTNEFVTVTPLQHGALSPLILQEEGTVEQTAEESCTLGSRLSGAMSGECHQTAVSSQPVL